MTKEARVVFEPQDILAVRVQCVECKNEVVLSRNWEGTFLPNCPSCGKGWREADTFSKLISALKAIKKSQGRAITVKLEISDN